MTRFEGDWTPFVEAAQRTDGDDQEWCERIAHVIKRHFPGTPSTWVGVMKHEGTASSFETLVAHTSDPKYRPGFDLARGGLDNEESFNAFYFPAVLATSHTEIERGISAEAASFSIGFRKSMKVDDVIGLITRPRFGEIVCMGALVNEPATFTSAERVILTRAALHLEAGYRLRKRPESVKAILDAEGRVLERLGELPELRGLRPGMTRSMDLWPALIAGRLSLVPRGKGRARRVLVVENDAESQRFRELTPLEVDALRLATRGLSAKMTAYALGVSEPRVSNVLSSASAKVGAATRLELVRLGAILTRDPRIETPRPTLTSSEREVLGLLQQGLSNEAIAQMRGRSIRTIANQVAALLRKTGSASRRELATRTD